MCIFRKVKSEKFLCSFRLEKGVLFSLLFTFGNLTYELLRDVFLLTNIQKPFGLALFGKSNSQNKELLFANSIILILLLIIRSWVGTKMVCQDYHRKWLNRYFIAGAVCYYYYNMQLVFRFMISTQLSTIILNLCHVLLYAPTDGYLLSCVFTLQ